MGRETSIATIIIQYAVDGHRNADGDERAYPTIRQQFALRNLRYPLYYNVSSKGKQLLPRQNTQGGLEPLLEEKPRQLLLATKPVGFTIAATLYSATSPQKGF